MQVMDSSGIEDLTSSISILKNVVLSLVVLPFTLRPPLSSLQNCFEGARKRLGLLWPSELFSDLSRHV
jgi:hypothetical protein